MFSLSPFVLFLSYMLGSVPFGLVLTRFAGCGDIRTIGSGNIGATNVLRTGKKGLAVWTLVLDAAKGAAAIWLSNFFTPEITPWAGFAALLGHMFPLWLDFKGGKGVATFFGVLLAMAWPLGLAALLAWLVTAALTRISSASALVAVICAPVFAVVFDETRLLPALVVMLVFIVAKHACNIKRLIRGTEPKIGRKT